MLPLEVHVHPLLLRATAPKSTVLRQKSLQNVLLLIETSEAQASLNVHEQLGLVLICQGSKKRT